MEYVQLEHTNIFTEYYTRYNTIEQSGQRFRQIGFWELSIIYIYIYIY